MSDEPIASDDDEIDSAEVPKPEPPDPFAKLPKPRHGFEIRGPVDVPAPPEDRDR